MSESAWPKFQSHKVVQAAVINALHDDLGEGDLFLWVDPGTGVLEKFVPTEIAMIHRAEIGGYAILYDDGFKSVSPKAAFEAGYKPVEPDAAELGAAARAAGLVR